MEFRKKILMNLPLHGSNGDTDGEQDMRGEAGIYAERNMETYITICKTDGQWEFAVWFRELNQGSVTA